MNVLLTCCGRKVYLIEEIRRALRLLLPDENHSVFVAEANPNSPSLCFADKGFLVQSILQPGYVDHIAELVREYGVTFLLPSKDLELTLFADAHVKKVLAPSLKLPLSSLETLTACQDKLLFHALLRDHFAMPRTATVEEREAAGIKVPCIVKERGLGVEGGCGFKLCENDTQLTTYAATRVSPICQDFIAGPEYTVDALFAEDSTPIAIVPRRRLSLRQQVSDVGITVESSILVRQTAQLGSHLKLKGPSNIQWIVDQCQRPWLIEVNPRISGGLQMTLAACPDYLVAMMAQAIGLKPAQLSYQPNVMTMKYDCAVSRRCDEHEVPTV